MSINAELADLLTTDGIEFYSENIPETVPATDTVGRVSDVSRSAGVEGNDEVYSLTHRIQIQVFYSTDLDFDPDEYEFGLIRKLGKLGWALAGNNGHAVDPDTGQLFVSLQFVSNKFYTTEGELDHATRRD